MAWSDLLVGFAFYLIFEGILPFASPAAWRRSLTSMAELPDTKLRTVGLVVMLAGLALLILVRN